jgi:signal transduction histidine kinase
MRGILGAELEHLLTAADIDAAHQESLKRDPYKALVTLACLDSLLDRSALPIELDRAGEPRQLPEVVDRGAYRVVRDALAAAGEATAATVAIEFVPGALVVQIEDNGGARDGLEDAADLAEALGGGLSAAPSPGGFRVRAWLPTEGQPPYRAAPPAVR